MQCSEWLLLLAVTPLHLLAKFPAVIFFFLKSIDFSHLMFCCPGQNISWAASGKLRRSFFLLFQTVEVRCSGTLFNPAAGSREQHDRKQNYQQWYAQTAFGIRNLRDSRELHLIYMMWLQETSGVISRRALAVKNVRLHKHTHVWCLAFRLKNILPLGKRVCLKVEVWLFDWVFCGTIAGNWSPISPLWHAGLLVWVWSRHCVGKFVFRCQYEQSRTRQNTKVALQFWNVWTELRHMQLLWLLDKDRFPQPGFTHVVHLDCAPNEKAFPEF